MAQQPNSKRKVVTLASLQPKASKRGRKSTVTAVDISDAQALAVGEAMLIPEFDLNGEEYAEYRQRRIARYNGDEAALINAWTSRYRQRVAALAKQSGVDLTAVTTDDGEMYAARQA